LGIRVVKFLSWWSLERVTAKSWCSLREFPKSQKIVWIYGLKKMGTEAG
jgi:hypothetical protein